ncbi:hypothetical protein FP2506_04466 [Fulvimarina pelagi HTCC2506]|uniref:Uncharacterized protein n=1 Tax=Fulvimarina pelagi HTCC2506 TaxID=314231 RepID=Q0FZY9_9HYPH|nr:hypothetical protein FP2506_04466 [Fulvimarina pelagi HTCC2506]
METVEPSTSALACELEHAAGRIIVAEIEKR